MVIIRECIAYPAENGWKWTCLSPRSTVKHQITVNLSTRGSSMGTMVFNGIEDILHVWIHACVIVTSPTKVVSWDFPDSRKELPDHTSSYFARIFLDISGRVRSYFLLRSSNKSIPEIAPRSIDCVTWFDSVSLYFGNGNWVDVHSKGFAAETFNFTRETAT